MLHSLDTLRQSAYTRSVPDDLPTLPVNPRMITTTKPDKYDRYLSDIFLERKSGGELFLNNLLLEKHHAVVKESFSSSDWD